MSAHPAELTHDPRALESLYRQARAEGVESSFREAIEQRLRAHAQDVLRTPGHYGSTCRCRN